MEQIDGTNIPPFCGCGTYEKITQYSVDDNVVVIVSFFFCSLGNIDSQDNEDDDHFSI